MSTQTISRNDFEQMVKCIRAYDPFTQYIEDYKQEQEANRKNDKLDDDFTELMKPYNPDIVGIPFRLMNLGGETEHEFVEWLGNKGLVVEERKQEQKKVWTEDEIKELVQKNDTVLYGALKKLYGLQTADEKKAGATKHYNGVGFNGADSKFLSSVSEFLIRKGFLTDKQKVVTRKKIAKYTKQLTRLANA